MIHLGIIAQMSLKVVLAAHKAVFAGGGGREEQEQ